MKLENKIKQEFQNREIKPSNNSWEILNAQLEVSSTKKENKKLKFLAYAAVFIGLLLSVVTFFNNNKTELNQPIIVDVNATKNQNPIIEESNTNKTIKLSNDFIKNEETTIVKVVEKKAIKIKIPQKANSKIHTEIAKVSTKKKVIINKEKFVFAKENSNDLNVNDKEQLVLNIIDKQKNDNLEITSHKLQTTKSKTKKKLFSSDADIDLMLVNALNKNEKNRIQKVNIQSTYLQYVVENEINTPIGNKILKTLKAGVDTVEEYITSNN